MPADVSGNLMSVLFTPDDLALVKRGRHLGAGTSSTAFGAPGKPSATASVLLTTYMPLGRAEKPPAQGRVPRRSGSWTPGTRRWPSGGATLLHSQAEPLLGGSRSLVSEVYAERRRIAEWLACRYAPSGRGSRGGHGLSRDELAGLMLEQMRLPPSRTDDLRRAPDAHVGPHRDDVVFEHRRPRRPGVRVVRASSAPWPWPWKMAEVRLCRGGRAATRPLLLLDDVMSELDAARRRRRGRGLAPARDRRRSSRRRTSGTSRRRTLAERGRW